MLHYHLSICKRIGIPGSNRATMKRWKAEEKTSKPREFAECVHPFGLLKLQFSHMLPVIYGKIHKLTYATEYSNIFTTRWLKPLNRIFSENFDSSWAKFGRV